MTDTKPYFRYANKRKREDHEGQQRGQRMAHKKKHYSAFLSPADLEAYEALSPGATEQLLFMAEEEQIHRHEWEDAYLRSYTKSHRIGLLFGFITAVLLVVASLWLGLAGNETAAAALSVSGFLALTINTVLSFKTRRFSRKPMVPTPHDS